MKGSTLRPYEITPKLQDVEYCVVLYCSVLGKAMLSHTLLESFRSLCLCPLSHLDFQSARQECFYVWDSTVLPSGIVATCCEMLASITENVAILLLVT